MKSLLSDIRRSLAATALFCIVCCGLYPLAVWAAGQTLFPARANGSLITLADGTVTGSDLIGQPFSDESHFQPRPSAAGTGKGYDATSSGGSNLGPTSAALADLIRKRVADYRTSNGLPSDAPVPADAVTASASGLDPHISEENARLQAPRVAKSRHLPLETVLSLIGQNTDRPWPSFLGDPGVHVLHLNQALDHLPH